MTRKMLIDAAHPEETRVVVISGNRIEEFDFETASKKPLKGNIYLAKVTRVEPSLQAAFVEYGGNRHGFLAFSEIHPDYYQIPVADRRALLEAQAAEDQAEEEEEERGAEDTVSEGALEAPVDLPPLEEPAFEVSSPTGDAGPPGPEAQPAPEKAALAAASAETPASDAVATASEAAPPLVQSEGPVARSEEVPLPAVEAGHGVAPAQPETEDANEAPAPGGDGPIAVEAADTTVEEIGEVDALEEVPQRTRSSQALLRRYRIQEVIKRRQILLVQVVKEERGNKGAALTTYLSLAGRYCVLMPNTGRGGGISRKITNASDRKRLRTIAGDLEVPEGMGLIVRTAGANRTKAEVKRDFEYLLRQWESVRDLTLRSTAPCLIYEEGSLIKRAIRDLYNRDIDTVLVAGEEAYKDAKSFMRMLMPSHAKNVQPYRDAVPLLQRYHIESQLDSMFNPVVTLPSGGYVVINQTEALVAIDVNSGRSTREHSIEETALKTNLEAAEEVARQLRLRDLAGLIVIDFIDMEEHRNNRAVERRLKEALKHDRARIQVGRISPFGLLEMSRQRLRTSVFEGSMVKCEHCGGTGHVRSVESTALRILRACEEEGIKDKWAEITVEAPVEPAMYLLNNKRSMLHDLEARYGLMVIVNASPAAMPGTFALRHGAELTPERREAVRSATVIQPETAFREEEAIDEALAAEAAVEEAELALEATEEAPIATTTGEQGEERSRRRRRRRRSRRGRPGEGEAMEAASPESEQPVEVKIEEEVEEEGAEADGGDVLREEDRGPRRRRRGRRGGRRNRGRDSTVEPMAAQPALDWDEIDTTPRDDRGPGSEAREPQRHHAEPSLDPLAELLGEPLPPTPSWHEERPHRDTGPTPRPEDMPQPQETGVAKPLPAPRPEERREVQTEEPQRQDPHAPVAPTSSEPPKERKGWWQRRIFG